MGYQVGNLYTNYWMNYTITSTPGTYDLNLRYGGYGGTVQVLLNGASLTTTNIQLPNWNGWNNYGTYTLRSVAVAASGTATLTLNFVNPDLNLNWIQFAPTNLIIPLSGFIIGTPGSWNNSGNTISNVFDGNLNTYFDAPTGTGAWVGLDLGAGATNAVCRVFYCPRSGNEYRMPGGMIQGANVRTSVPGWSRFSPCRTPTRPPG